MSDTYTGEKVEVEMKGKLIGFRRKTETYKECQDRLVYEAERLINDANIIRARFSAVDNIFISGTISKNNPLF